MSKRIADLQPNPEQAGAIKGGYLKKGYVEPTKTTTDPTKETTTTTTTTKDPLTDTTYTKG